MEIGLVLGSLQQGLIYGLLALGIYISFRILNIPDLTAEGSFTFGLAVSAVFTVAGHPIIGVVMAMLSGVLAGVVTGLLQTKLKVHPVLSGILTMSGLYSVNLFVMGKSSNLSLIGSDTIFKLAEKTLVFDSNIVKLIIAIAFAVVGLGVLILFFKTQLGLCIRATGDNEAMVRASSIDVDTTKIIAIALSNCFIALCGGIMAQYQGFADINSGVGILVVGLASVIIGEALIGKRGVTVGFVSAIIGSIIYRFIMAIAINSNIFPAFALKLVSAIIVAIALSLPTIKYYIELNKIKKEARQNA